MGSILSDMESHFKEVDSNYFEQNGFTYEGGDIYQKTMEVEIPIEGTQFSFNMNLVCRYFDSFVDDYKRFTIYPTQTSLVYARAILGFETFTFEKLVITRPTAAEIEAAMQPVNIVKQITY